MRLLSVISALCVLLTILAYHSPKEEEQPLKLWYTQPAEEWTEALPIGNGRLGGMIFGGVAEERIQFNEETLWTGEPRAYHREGAAAYLPEIRELLFEGKQEEAEALAEQEFMGRMHNEDSYDTLRKTWLGKVRSLKGLSGNPAEPGYDDSGWETMTIPTEDGWRSADPALEGIDGAVWFRTTFDLPEEWTGKDLVVELGRIRDHDFTYVNGKQVGSVNDKDIHRKYTVPKAVLKAGENVMAVQVINYFDKGGFTGFDENNEPLAVYPVGEKEAHKIPLGGTWKYKIQNVEPPAFPDYMAKYQPFGDLKVYFNGHDGAQNYCRELDITKAVAKTTYEVDGVQYTREYFASEPNQVIVMHISASEPGKINFEAELTSPHHHHATRKIDDQTLGLSVDVIHGVLEGESYLKVQASNGQVAVSEDQIIVEGADEATLYLTAGTNFKNYQDVSGNPAAVCTRAIQTLKDKEYNDIKSAHIQEYQQYFNTFSIDLGDNANDTLPTDERIKAFPDANDPAFVALHMQYGRYLLISSSRPGTQPANLQGIWNDKLSPPWESKYTTNINLEMNYWPAELLNLSPCHEPLFGLIEDVAENGRKTAKAHYDCRGWVLHHNTDLWRGTAPINASNHGIWVTGGAWLCHHLWERYLFTQDTVFLKERAYPLMKEAAKFFVDFLMEDPETGWLISTPSNSPELGGLVAGPTMDHQIIRDLFNNCMQASEILGIDEAFSDTLKNKHEKIAPNQIGKHGQLQEWLEDKDDPDEHHRHVSHLWGLHPGNEINWEETPELFDAARQSLIFRGDAGTGWSLAWKINFWARLRDGDHAYEMIKMLLSPAGNERGGSYPNLFDAHPPFQIDGNFGGAAGVAEMLVQSHINNTIDLLPALPTALPEGEVKGICARGGFELNMRWAEGQLEALEVISKAGKQCSLRYGDKEIRFDTEKGETYQLDQNLKLL